METSLQEAASEPDKNMTDDWIDGPLISLLLLVSWGTRKHYGGRSAQSVTSVSGSEASRGHMRENTEATHRTAASDVARTYYCDAPA